MVYTVTLNPALDYVLHLDGLQPGAANRAGRSLLQWGGKGINVSAVLHRLGVETTALGFAAGFTGRELARLLDDAGIPAGLIVLPEGMTRINVKLRADQETEINTAGPAVSEDAMEQLLRRLDRLTGGDALVLAGSVPPPLADDTYRRMLERLAGRGVLTVVDAAGGLLRSALACGPFLIKPNRSELGGLFGREPANDAEIADCARQLQRWGARNVLASLAQDGSLLLDETGALHRLPAPRGTVRSSVGAGDSMVAGFLAGWLAYHDYGQAHRLGTAAGAATAFSDGLASREAIEALLRQI